MKDPYYAHELRKRLEQLYQQGFTVIERWELRTWWDCDRLSKTVWQEIMKIWNEIAEEGEDIHVTFRCGRYVFIQPGYYKSIEKRC